jgi:DNA-directed RNA polymerase subunit E"
MRKACKSCNKITEEGVCPACGGHDLSTRFQGLVVILDPENSEVAKRLDIKMPGEYALKVT